MLSQAGETDDRTLALEGAGYAIAAISPSGHHAHAGPAWHADARGLLVWAGEMFLPESWTGGKTADSPNSVAAIVRHRLLLDGPEILAHIDGSFCGAWFDVQANSWTIFNDRWGLIPLFWWTQGQRLIVSPKARITFQASEKPLRIDEHGVADLLRTQNMLDDHTLISGLHWLEPARCLQWDGASIDTRRYWDFQHRPHAAVCSGEVLTGFVEASRSTIARMTDTGGQILQGISGGLDSRMFLAVCHELGRVPACYTSGFAYSEDMRFGRKLARAAGASHDALLLDERLLPDQLRQSILETDGLHGAGHLVMSAPIASHLARHAGAVLIEGYLHGVLGGSDLPADADVPGERPAHQHTWALDFLHGGGEPELIGNLLSPRLATDSLARWRSHVDDTFARSRVEDPLCRAEYTIVTGRSGRNDVLVPAMFRRHVLARHPACDRRMVDWYATTPACMRRARQAYVDVLRMFYPRFARVPRADGCSGMPLASENWRREYHWQAERLYSWWARRRYPQVRSWGRDSRAARAWAFDACRRAGMFEPMLACDARIYEWVRPHAVRNLWDRACREPRQSIPLLSLFTIESTVRELERPAAKTNLDAGPAFRCLSIGAVQARECVEVP
jgi:hypothetical protein